MTNLVEQLGGQEAMESVARNLIGEFGWIFLAGVAVLMFRELVQTHCSDADIVNSSCSSGA